MDVPLTLRQPKGKKPSVSTASGVSHPLVSCDVLLMIFFFGVSHLIRKSLYMSLVWMVGAANLRHEGVKAKGLPVQLGRGASCRQRLQSQISNG